MENYLIASATDVGIARQVNEDSMIVFDSPNGHVMAVCDGMGGQAAGDVASKLAVNIIKDILSENTFASPEEAIKRSIMAANQDAVHRGCLPNHVFCGPLAPEEPFDTCRLEVIPAEEIFEKEPALLEYAKSRLPRILLPETDVLMVHEIGKNFSGSGMDPNVTGTFGTPFASGGIRKQRTVVFDLSEQTHGSFVGLGMADVTTERAFEKLDTNATYFNMITSTVLQVGKIPMIMEDDRLALQVALRTLTQVDRDHIRMVYLKNTLSLETIMVSEALLDEVRARDDMEILEAPRDLRFDENGTLLDFA